jgi:hypothetical protein
MATNLREIYTNDYELTRVQANVDEALKEQCKGEKKGESDVKGEADVVLRQLSLNGFEAYLANFNFKISSSVDNYISSTVNGIYIYPSGYWELYHVVTNDINTSTTFLNFYFQIQGTTNVLLVDNNDPSNSYEIWLEFTLL